MDSTLLIIAGSLTLFVIIVMVSIRARKTHQRNKDIAKSLDTIRNAVELNRKKGINAPEINVNPAFEKL